MQSSSRELGAYKSIGIASAAEGSNAHRLIDMLLGGALDKIAAAKGHIVRDEIEAKCTQISGAISIMDGLRCHLDKQRGGQIASNLDQLYEYISARLTQANASNSCDVLDEVSSLLCEIREAWQQIAPAAVSAG